MKQISVLKIKEWDEIAWAVIISEKGNPNNTYCIYKDKEMAESNADALSQKFKEE